MALPGFELLYSSLSRDVRTADDALIAAVHWNLISNGLKCLGEGEAQSEQELKVGPGKTLKIMPLTLVMKL